MMVVAAAAVIAALALSSGGDASAQSARESDGVSVTCPPMNTFNPDAGPLFNGLIACGAGYRAMKAEVKSGQSSKAYFCGKTGTSKTNYASTCFERCPTCDYGGKYIAESYAGIERCLSDSAAGNDAGVLIIVRCVR